MTIADAVYVISPYYIMLIIIRYNLFQSSIEKNAPGLILDS